jgi:hypothetical protein
MLLAGTAGGIIGTIASAFGIIWILTYLFAPSYPFLFIPTGPTDLQIVISLIFLSLFLVACILTGIGFYGLYKLGGSSMGIVALIFSIICGSSFLVLGLLSLFVTTTLLAWIGMLIILVSFIIIGVASIVLREITENPGVMMAAGILSIIGAVLLGFILAFYKTEA